jgi:hypothetical protein
MNANARWRYLVVELKPNWLGRIADEVLQAELDRQGAQGWELVQTLVTQRMGGIRLIFKRSN